MESQAWNKLVQKHAPKSGAFLQSFEWGEFQRQTGKRVERIHQKEGETEIVAQAIKMPLPMGQFYWYIPKGPLGNMPQERMISSLREHLLDAMFFRLEPAAESTLPKVKDVQPSTTTIVNITPSEKDLLASMKAKTRYNIRLAERKGVSCRIVDASHFDDFARLLDQTSNRDSFTPHAEVYYRTMLHNLKAGEAKASLAMAFYEDRPLAANIILDFQGTRTYLHGATSNLHRNTMPQYALHWFLIKDAKKQGLTAFDFWGIAPRHSDVSHAWTGISRYKKGFGGEIIESPGTFDLQQKHIWYWLYKLGRKARK